MQLSFSLCTLNHTQGAGGTCLQLTKIAVERFKRIAEATLDISSVNILVGGNNAGKSSILEAIHFCVVAATASRIAETRTVTQDSLPFCPAKHFVDLRNGSPYKNQSNFGYLRVFSEDGDDEFSCNIKVYRGRNEGNVGCEVSGSPNLRQVISDPSKPFSVYVPGVSGIPQTEELRSESIVRRGVASGEANLYLRNVIYLISQRKLIKELHRLMRQVFPGFIFLSRLIPSTIFTWT